MFVFVLACITLRPSRFCNHLDEEERTGSFAYIVLRISCFCRCSVALSNNVVGWSGVFDRSIS